MNGPKIFHRGDRVYRYVVTSAGTYEPQALVVSRMKRRTAIVRTTSGALLRLSPDEIYPPFGVLSPVHNRAAWGADGATPGRRLFRWGRRPDMVCARCGDPVTADDVLGYVHPDGRLVGSDRHWVAPIEDRRSGETIAEPADAVQAVVATPVPPWSAAAATRRGGSALASDHDRETPPRS
jgi:hypothetical protein